MAAFRRDQADVLRRTPFPIYGLDGRWTGRRWQGGSGRSDGEVDRIELGHGDPWDDAAPLVRVETLRIRKERERMTEVSAAQELAEVLWHEGADHSVVRGAFTSDPTGSWSELTLPVNGEGTSFRRLAAGPWWVALGRVQDVYVAVKARGVDDAGIGLVAVDDPGPYLSDDGSPG
jgi:hypothetical protein